MSAPERGEAFAAFAATWTPRIEAALHELVPPAESEPTSLHGAMRYALFPGGKRLRPLLVLLGCRAVGGDPAAALEAAAGLECLHTYSLVHDDLPCMDDDDLRRGRKTCHREYGEAIALLAGDALLTLALVAAATAGATAVRVLGEAAGSLGMVGGQAADLQAEGGQGERTIERVRWIHDRKTGALITAALQVGALAGAAGETLPDEVMKGVTDFGDRLGRAFQIVDDCLDLTGSAAELGKNPQADVALDKLTWPALVGLEESREHARQLVEEACQDLPRWLCAAAQWRGNQALLDEARLLLQDVAFAAIDRRS